MTAREDVYNALFTILSGATWGSGSAFAFKSRKVIQPASLPAQPALMLVSHVEIVSQVTGLPYRQTWKASAIICHKAGIDPNAIPAQTDDLIIDAIFTALQPVGYDGERQTLGGLVHHCFVDGSILKFPGDFDGQSLIQIPISILVP